MHLFVRLFTHDFHAVPTVLFEEFLHMAFIRGEFSYFPGKPCSSGLGKIYRHWLNGIWKTRRDMRMHLWIAFLWCLSGFGLFEMFGHLVGFIFPFWISEASYTHCPF